MISVYRYDEKRVHYCFPRQGKGSLGTGKMICYPDEISSTQWWANRTAIWSV